MFQNGMITLPKTLTDLFQSLYGIVILCIFISVSALISFCVGRFAAHKFHGDKCKTVWGFILVTVPVTIALISFYGLSLKTIQGYIFTLILLYASYSDIKTRECDDFISVMLLITSFIGASLKDIPSMFIAGVFTAGIFILVVLTISDGIGGADIKIASASIFLLGFSRGIIGLIAGLLIAVVVNLIKNKKAGFPMLPYLSIGFIPAFFI